MQLLPYVYVPRLEMNRVGSCLCALSGSTTYVGHLTGASQADFLRFRRYVHQFVHTLLRAELSRPQADCRTSGPFLCAR